MDGPKGLVSRAAQRDRFIETKKAVTICPGVRSTKEIIMANKPELVQAPFQGSFNNGISSEWDKFGINIFVRPDKLSLYFDETHRVY
jgi:hypothetical protein